VVSLFHEITIPRYAQLLMSSCLIKGAKEIYYPGAQHGLTATHQDQVNTDLLAFLDKAQKSSTAA
jgi:non-heme chloroperoxidase